MSGGDVGQRAPRHWWRTYTALTGQSIEVQNCAFEQVRVNADLAPRQTGEHRERPNMGDFPPRYYAHSGRSPNRTDWQLLVDHLRAVGDLARCRGKKFGVSAAATYAGLFHNLGKFTVGFQRRLEGRAPLDHATAGPKRSCGRPKHRVIASLPN